MQSWGDRIRADGDHVELRARLRSPDDHVTQRAFLELYLQEMFTGPGTPSRSTPSWPPVPGAQTCTCGATVGPPSSGPARMQPHARGVMRPHERSIGIYAHTPAVIVNDAPTIREALSEKHHAYGDLGDHSSSRWACTSSTRTVGMPRRLSTGPRPGSPDGSRPDRVVRRPDGYSGTSPGWVLKQVSGVLLVNQLQPFSRPRAQVAL